MAAAHVLLDGFAEVGDDIGDEPGRGRRGQPGAGRDVVNELGGKLSNSTHASTLAPGGHFGQIPARIRARSRPLWAWRQNGGVRVDRKSTRLNSSHVTSSYAVFCWKKRT